MAMVFGAVVMLFLVAVMVLKTIDDDRLFMRRPDKDTENKPWITALWALLCECKKYPRFHYQLLFSVQHRFRMVASGKTSTSVTYCVKTFHWTK